MSTIAEAIEPDAHPRRAVTSGRGAMGSGAVRGTVRALWPLLTVQNIAASIAFYRDRLGFDVIDEAKGPEGLFWCRLTRDGASLMLQQGDEAEDGPAEGRGRGVALYFVCDDADAMY